MPTYEYACRACGHRFEAVQSILDAALDTCPECGGEVRRVIGAVGVAFKGSGFYRNDARDASKRASASGAKAPSDPAAPAPAAPASAPAPSGGSTASSPAAPSA